MDLLHLLEKEHSKKQCDRIVRYIGDDSSRFAELMRLFLHGEYRINQRAAWPMSYCVRNYPALIRPYFKTLLQNLRKKGLHPAVVRNTLRILQDIDIPKAHHGKLMNMCFDLLQEPQTPVAIKAFSLTVLGNLSAEYPDIRPELKLIIEEQWEQASAGFRSRARRVLKMIQKA